MIKPLFPDVDGKRPNGGKAVPFFLFQKVCATTGEVGVMVGFTAWGKSELVPDGDTGRKRKCSDHKKLKKMCVSHHSASWFAQRQCFKDLRVSETLNRWRRGLFS